MLDAKVSDEDECFLSFAGCGFLGLYHAGVCACIQNYAPQLYRNRKIAGASAGALAAASMVCDLDANVCVEYTLRVLTKAQNFYLGPFDPRFKVCEYIREGLEIMLPHNAHELCSGRLYISLTSKSTHKNYIVSHFPTRSDLIRALLCTSYIPIFSGFVPYTFHGEQMVDGGLSNNIPCLGKHTITVSPFSGEANICPRDSHFGYGPIHVVNSSLLLNFENLCRVVNIVMPKSLDDLQKLTEDGYNDALRFLALKGFIRCCDHSVTGCGRVVFLTLKIRTHHGLVDHCPDCKRRLREALSSSIPHNVRAIFSSRASMKGVTGLMWLKETRLFRLFQLLVSPTTMSMSILYSLIRRLLDALSQAPSPLQHLFSPMKSLLVNLNDVIVRSLRQSTNRSEQAKILCDNLKEHYPTSATDQPADAPDALVDLTALSYKKVREPLRDSMSIDDNMSEGFVELGDVEFAENFSQSDEMSRDSATLDHHSDDYDGSSTLGTSSDSDDEDDVGSIMQLNDDDNSEWSDDLLKRSDVLQQMTALNSGGDCEVRIDSLRPVNLQPYIYSHAEDEEVKSCCHSRMCHTEEVPITTGATNAVHRDVVDSSADPQVRSCWSYQDYEGSEVTKLFMVVPLSGHH